ncbi:hypothetical protein ABT235_11520 [Micromonospora echinofusca]|uniref:5-methylcytosine restriction system specificity protein McrC n=1 Tax=Micromonospora echinofusca TaxID=47858 RepID=UPI003325A479
MDPFKPTRASVVAGAKGDERLRIALRLAELVLAGASVEAGRGAVLSNAFLLDMWRVFEDFLSVVLRAAIESAYGGTVGLLARVGALAAEITGRAGGARVDG